MFDANLRYLPEGTVFFAKVHHIKDKNSLYDHGVRADNILLMRKLTDDNENVAVTVYLEDKEFEVHCSFDDEFSYYSSAFITYEGNLDLTGFINDISLEKSKRIKFEMSGEFKEYLGGK